MYKKIGLVMKNIGALGEKFNSTSQKRGRVNKPGGFGSVIMK